MKVGYLGPKGTFSHEACLRCFDKEEKIPFRTIKETIQALVNDEIDRCIVPIENSLQGCVVETIDTLIADKNIYVIGEEILEIKQNLMANKNYSLDEIKIVYSHPQALAQCRKFIDNNLKQAEIINVASTALAALEVSKKNYCACIGNIECLKEYNLELLKANIQDNSFNKTRFWILSKNKNTAIGTKMSIIFKTEHKPGSLYRVLKVFNDYNINLTKIESRPDKKSAFEYYFLVDCETSNLNIEQALDELKTQTPYFRMLGIYNEGGNYGA